MINLLLRHTLNVPIIMLSAKDEEIDKILGLELGADDYITKLISYKLILNKFFYKFITKI